MKNLPLPPGRRAVGMRKIAFGAGDRRVQACIWYPAKPAGGEPRCYHNRQEADALAQARAVLGAPGPVDARLTKLGTNSVEGAVVATGPFPLVIFNHGGVLDPLSNISLMEALASSGYIAASIGHAQESAALVWEDATSSLIDAALLDEMRLSEAAMKRLSRFVLAPSEAKRREHLAEFLQTGERGLSALASRWASDSIAFADLLHSAACPWPDISGAMKRGTIAYAGMSLGGAASFLCCLRDERARGGIDLDGTIWDFDKIDLHLPAAFLEICASSETDLDLMAGHALEYAGQAKGPRRPRSNDFYFESPERRGARTDIIRLEIDGATHGDFTDQPMIEQILAGEEPSAAILTVNRLCVAFLDWVFGRASKSLFFALAEHDPKIREIQAYSSD